MLSLLKLLLSLAIPLLLLTVVPEPAQAHGPVLSFTSTTTDGMIVDVDYSDLAISAGNAGRFSFNLFKDASRSEPADFYVVFVRIAKDTEGYKEGETIYSGIVTKRDFGGTGFSLWLPEAGTYRLSARYYKSKNDEDVKVAEAVFKLDVAPAWGADKIKLQSKEFGFGVGLGLLMALILGFAVYFRKNIRSIVTNFATRVQK